MSGVVTVMISIVSEESLQRDRHTYRQTDRQAGTNTDTGTAYVNFFTHEKSEMIDAKCAVFLFFCFAKYSISWTCIVFLP